MKSLSALSLALAILVGCGSPKSDTLQKSVTEFKSRRDASFEKLKSVCISKRFLCRLEFSGRDGWIAWAYDLDGNEQANCHFIHDPRNSDEEQADAMECLLAGLTSEPEPAYFDITTMDDIKGWGRAPIMQIPNDTRGVPFR